MHSKIEQLTMGADKDHAVSEAWERLEQNPLLHGCARFSRIARRKEALILRGTLPSYYLKQVLQTILRDIEGITFIDNQVDVFWPREN